MASKRGGRGGRASGSASGTGAGAGTASADSRPQVLVTSLGPTDGLGHSLPADKMTDERAGVYRAWQAKCASWRGTDGGKPAPPHRLEHICVQDVELAKFVSPGVVHPRTEAERDVIELDMWVRKIRLFYTLLKRTPVAGDFSFTTEVGAGRYGLAMKSPLSVREIPAYIQHNIIDQLICLPPLHPVSGQLRTMLDKGSSLPAKGKKSTSAAGKKDVGGGDVISRLRTQNQSALGLSAGSSSSSDANNPLSTAELESIESRLTTSAGNVHPVYRIADEFLTCRTEIAQQIASIPPEPVQSDGVSESAVAEAIALRGARIKAIHPATPLAIETRRLGFIVWAYDDEKTAREVRQVFHWAQNALRAKDFQLVGRPDRDHFDVSICEHRVPILDASRDWNSAGDVKAATDRACITRLADNTANFHGLNEQFAIREHVEQCLGKHLVPDSIPEPEVSFAARWSAWFGQQHATRDAKCAEDWSKMHPMFSVIMTATGGIPQEVSKMWGEAMQKYFLTSGALASGQLKEGTPFYKAMSIHMALSASATVRRMACIGANPAPMYLWQQWSGPELLLSHATPPLLRCTGADVVEIPTILSHGRDDSKRPANVPIPWGPSAYVTVPGRRPDNSRLAVGRSFARVAQLIGSEVLEDMGGVSPGSVTRAHKQRLHEVVKELVAADRSLSVADGLIAAVQKSITEKISIMLVVNINDATMQAFMKNICEAIAADTKTSPSVMPLSMTMLADGSAVFDPMAQVALAAGGGGAGSVGSVGGAGGLALSSGTREMKYLVSTSRDDIYRILAHVATTCNFPMRAVTHSQLAVVCDWDFQKMIFAEITQRLALTSPQSATLGAHHSQTSGGDGGADVGGFGTFGTPMAAGYGYGYGGPGGHGGSGAGSGGGGGPRDVDGDMKV